MNAPLRVVLATSNGSGMGHLTRQLAVALALGEQAECTVFSMSLAAPVVAQPIGAAPGVRTEYCPSYERGWMPARDWHRYLRDRLIALVREVNADAVVFDGVAPYLGLRLARAKLPGTAFIWSRRGMWVAGANERALEARHCFDLVVEPGDLADGADRGATARMTDAVRVPPVSLLDVLQPLPREQAAAELGLDPARRAVLVTLGSGRLGDASTVGAAAVRALLSADPEVQIAITRAAIAKSGLGVAANDRVTEIRGVYPLARYLSAFDAAVSAAGYNAVHELLPAGVPTLLVPNAMTTTDDQAARAAGVARAGWALHAPPDDADAVGEACRRLLQPETAQGLIKAIGELPDRQRGGAQAFAAEVLSCGRRFAGHRAGPEEIAAHLGMLSRDAVQQAIGPDATALARRVLGRRPPAGPRRRIGVRLVEEPADTPADAPLPGLAPPLPAVLTERLHPRLIRSGAPLEHLLPGSSADYRQRRRQIIGRYYSLAGRA